LGQNHQPFADTNSGHVNGNISSTFRSQQPRNVPEEEDEEEDEDEGELKDSSSYHVLVELSTDPTATSVEELPYGSTYEYNSSYSKYLTKRQTGVPFLSNAALVGSFANRFVKQISPLQSSNFPPSNQASNASDTPNAGSPCVTPSSSSRHLVPIFSTAPITSISTVALSLARDTLSTVTSKSLPNRTSLPMSAAVPLSQLPSLSPSSSSPASPHTLPVRQVSRQPSSYRSTSSVKRKPVGTFLYINNIILPSLIHVLLIGQLTLPEVELEYNSHASFIESFMDYRSALNAATANVFSETSGFQTFWMKNCAYLSITAGIFFYMGE
jgi:hypothetical protein